MKARSSTLLLGGLLLVIAAVIVVLVRAGCFGQLAPAPGPISTMRDGTADADTFADPRTVASTGTSRSSAQGSGAGESKTLRLTVVEAGTGRPLAGAKVHVWADPSERFSIERYDEMLWMGPDVGAFLSARGTPHEADANGIVELPVSAEHRYACARVQPLFGVTEIDADQEEAHELVLAPAHDIEVLVRDVAGRVRAGVPVGLAEWTDTEPLWMSTTDASGRCRIPDVEMFVSEASIEDDSPIAVRLILPTSPPVEHWFDQRSVPSQTIDLVLPETGTLRLRTVDEHGNVVPADALVTVGPVDDGVPGRWDPNSTESWSDVRLVRGVGIATFVPLGRRLFVEARITHTDLDAVEFDGPRTAGESVDVDIPIAPGHVWMHGRLVDDGGLPVARARLSWSCAADDGASTLDADGGELETDRDGLFQCAIEREPYRFGPAAQRRLRLSEGRRDATLTLPLSIRTAVHDLGDVVFAASAPLASGRVTDASGAGIANVRVEALEDPPEQEAEPSNDERRPRRQWTREAWDCDAQRTDEGGNFALHGPCPPGGHLALRFDGRAFDAPKTIPVACGTTAIQVVVPEVGGLSGSVLVDSRFDERHLEVRFVPEQGSDRHRYAAELQRQADRCTFTIEDIPVCRGRVLFWDTLGPSVCAHDVVDVEVTARTMSRPPALVDVDLRGKLRTSLDKTDELDLELEVVDREGHPLPRGIAWVWVEGTTSRRRTWTAGRVRLRGAVQQVEVWSPGHRSRILAPPFENRRVVLDPELDVEIEFVLPKAIVGRGFQFEGSAWHEAKDDDAPPQVLDGNCTFPVGTDGKGRVRLPSSGKLMFALSVRGGSLPVYEKDGWYNFAYSSAPLDVRDVDGVQTLRCELDAEHVERALEELELSKD